jgi:hypothetical protein
MNCELTYNNPAYIFNVNKNKLSWQTGSRNLMGPKTLTGGGGYTVLPLSVIPSKIFFGAFFSATIDDRNLIFGHKLHIGSW